tara:strand:+ start:5751 stop:6806 length:1056 start_codon:yes stop_codon:yes gene_type:complete
MLIRELQEGTRCWKGYKKKGTKKMFGKTVPNCVKNEEVDKDTPCPACGDSKCKHKEDHIKERVAPLSKSNSPYRQAVDLWLSSKDGRGKTEADFKELSKLKQDKIFDKVKIKEEEVTSGNRNIALHLPRGEMKVLKAEEKDYDRGLLVKLLDNGGYEMAYWYEKHVPFPVEVIVDGKSISKDAEIVEMKFHPELTPGAEDKGTRFKLYDIEADIKDLKDKIASIKNENIKETIEASQDLNALMQGIDHDLANREKEIEENLRAWFGKGKDGGAGGGGWDAYNTKGERTGKCGDTKGKAKPKCLSKSKAASLRAKGGKKAIGAAVSKKRRNDPNKNRKGKAKNVSSTVGKKK